LRKSPGFSITVVVVLALAIGANTAIFSAVEGVLLQPLPFRDPDRLMLVLLYNPELLSRSMGRQTFPTLLLIAFAGLAFVLATVGTYGLVSYSTKERMREIGIRVALGARRRDVLRMMVGQGFRLALIGVAIGVFAAVVLAHVLPGFSHLLYGVEATDPLTLVGTSFILIVTAVAASCVPARRASKMDPMSVLRND
jgi:ABC-type antimicrobial peptide transport system permease subunit